VACLAGCPSRGWVAYAERCLQPAIVILDAASGTLVTRLMRPEVADTDSFSLAAMAFNTAGTLLVTMDAAPANTLHVWDLLLGAIFVKASPPAQSTAAAAAAEPSMTSSGAQSHSLVVAPGPATAPLRFAHVAQGQVVVWHIETCDGLTMLVPQPVDLLQRDAGARRDGDDGLPAESLAAALTAARRRAGRQPVSACWAALTTPVPSTAAADKHVRGHMRAGAMVMHHSASLSHSATAASDDLAVFLSTSDSVAGHLGDDALDSPFFVACADGEVGVCCFCWGGVFIYI
jgi:hypothetical protein